MMRNLLIILLISSYLGCFGQFKEFKSISSGDSTYWTIKNEIPDGAYSFPISLGDTVTIGKHIYYKTYSGGWFSNPYLIGYFRENSRSGKAWFWGKNDTTEYLIMDLSLKVGDTFLVKLHDFDVTLAKVRFVDTLSGRKVLTLDYHYGGGFISEDLKFIEGVGPNTSLLFQADDKLDFDRNSFGFLVCLMYRSDSIVYAWDPVDFGCGWFFNGVEDNQLKGEIEVYPNPFQSKVKFILSDNFLFKGNLQIFTLHGQKVFEQKINQNEIEVDLAGFSSQTFVYHIQHSGKSTSGVIVKR